MLKTCISSLFILLMMTTQAFCWEMSEFMIYVWGVPKTDNLETKAKALADAGVTIVNWEPDKLDILQKYGLKAMVHNPTPEIAAKLSKHPALWGYHCGDEPYPEDKFPPIAQQFIDLKKSDPNHPAFINMLSTTGDFLRTYMEVVKPEILSYDYYQWWWGSDRYFEKLEQLREAALLADIPLACCLEVTANPEVERGDNTYLADNRLKLRQSVYTALAYGVKGIEWFNASAMFKPESTELTQAGKDVKALNTELKLIGPELVKLKSVDVYHTPPLALGTSEAPKEYWVHLIGEETKPGLVQGMFKDHDGTDYLMVSNRDYANAQSVVVRLQSKWLGIAPWHTPKKYKYSIDKFNKKTGKWDTLSSSSFVGFTFVVAPADGDLFRIKTIIEE